MHWFFLAIFVSALWGAVNHIDKYLIGTYFKGGGEGALIIFSSLVGVFVFPFVALVYPHVFDISLFQIVAIIVSSVLLLSATLMYLYALGRDEASVVVPFFQTIPVFACLLGYFVLRETLTLYQIIGSILIIIAGIVLSLEITQGVRPKIKAKLVICMLSASFFIALNGLIFKTIAIETHFWTVAFWGYVGDFLVGIFFFVCIKKYRLEFLSVIQGNTLPVLGLNMLNEGINILAMLLFRFATLIAPIALVWTIAYGFQPLFVFVFGVLITIFFPFIASESLLRKDVIQKISAISIMFLGTYIINF